MSLQENTSIHRIHLNAGQQEKPGREVPHPLPLGTLSQDVAVAVCHMHLPESCPPLVSESPLPWSGGGLCVSRTASSFFFFFFKAVVQRTFRTNQVGMLAQGGCVCVCVLHTKFWCSPSNSLPLGFSFGYSPCWVTPWVFLLGQSSVLLPPKSPRNPSLSVAKAPRAF